METVIMNMAFLSSLQTRLILFYLTIVCNLATCSFNSSKLGDDMNLDSGCRYTYPSYINPYTTLVKIDLISCKNMLIREIPFYENVTTMELINVPLTVLNETEIPNAVRSLRVDLRQLRWTKSYIKIIEIVPMENLSELDLSWNLINDVRENAFKDLLNMKVLNLSHNSIEVLPTGIFAKRNTLRILSLASNQLRTIPPDMLNDLVHLQTLDLSNNLLKHLHDLIFHQNQRLEDLNLAYNQFTQLPSKILKPLPALKYFSVEANQISRIEPGTFDQQQKLLRLNLGKNPLLSLPGSLLPHNNTLQALTISHTKLAYLKPAVLQNMHKLHRLYLTDNHQLQNLLNDTFVNGHRLKVIHLQNNNFTQLPYSILNTEPEELILDGNPWQCDCSTQWIVIWANSLKSYDSNDLNVYKDNLQLIAHCNATGQDLVEVLRKLNCKPTILYVSPVRYESLEAKVKLSCKSYANPIPAISWLTPNGLIYVKSTLIDSGTNERSNSVSSTVGLPQFSNSAFIKYHHLSKNANNAPLNHDNNLHLDKKGDLDIKQMGRDDAGEYICIASNKMGESIAYTRLYVDPSIMQRIKTGSIICGFLWINTFLLFSIIYILIRRYSRKAKHEKRKQRMHENMDIYKSQQISRLRERCKNQMQRIKNNCCTQVEWMKDNYVESINTAQDNQLSYLSSQYSEQLGEIRDYYIIQIHKVCEHFEQQHKLISVFSINQVGNGKELQTCSSSNKDIIVRMENGTASTQATTINKDDIYHYSENIISEIHKLTLLCNLNEALAAKSESRFEVVTVGTSNKGSLSRHNVYADKSNCKLRTSEDEGDEKTSMLNNANFSH